jgi:serine/threonine-protein kinase
MASVYRATDEWLEREVAVKVIAEDLARDPLFVRRFREEAKVCARLEHPNVVAVLDAGVDPRDFIVMEFVDGVDAGALLRGERPTPDQTVQVVVQICDALAYVHDQGVVHQDVAPRNILIERPGGTAKLADFGLASSPPHAPGRWVPDVTGTPGYVAPEVLRGDRPSPWSDLYSLGVVAYRLLTGPRGVWWLDPQATSPQATAVPRMPPLAEARPGLSRALMEAVQKAMAPDPGERQDSVAQFGAQLVAAQSAPLLRRRTEAMFPAAGRGQLSRAA